jgi:hypothetical protein
MRRPLILAAVLVMTGCGGAQPEPLGPARAAEPQQVALGWRESYPPSGERLVFTVEKLVVSDEGWSADVSVTNKTRIAFDTGGDTAASTYGLMLFATGDLGELEDAAGANRLPAVRQARTIEPALPELLRPNETWSATLSAPGSLADGSWVRVSFGPLRAEGDPPPEMEPVVVWITDSAYRV